MTWAALDNERLQFKTSFRPRAGERSALGSRPGWRIAAVSAELLVLREARSGSCYWDQGPYNIFGMKAKTFTCCCSGFHDLYVNSRRILDVANVHEVSGSRGE